MSSTAPQRVITVGGGAEPQSGGLAKPPAGLAWPLLGWVGLVFLLIGLLDLSLGWFPPHFGNPEWEFGTVTRSLDRLPITVLGLALALAAAAERRAGWAVRAAALLCWALAALLLVGLVVFLLDVPVALKAVTQPALRTGLIRAIAKAVVQGMLYPTVLVMIGLRAVRATGRARQ